MDNKVQNEQQPVLPDEASFNDCDILQDVSTSLKHLLTMYGLLCQEASNQTLADRVDQLSKETSTMARSSFNLMFEKGWYGLERQPQQKLTEEYNKFQQKVQYL